MNASERYYDRVMASPDRPPSHPPGPRLRVGVVLARRFTLAAFANVVDVLRLSADGGDRSRPIHCSWKVLLASMDPVRSSCGIAIGPDEAPGDPARFDYIVVVGGLIDEIERPEPAYTAFLQRAAAARVPRSASAPVPSCCTGPG